MPPETGLARGGAQRHFAASRHPRELKLVGVLRNRDLLQVGALGPGVALRRLHDFREPPTSNTAARVIDPRDDPQLVQHPAYGLIEQQIVLLRLADDQSRIREAGDQALDEDRLEFAVPAVQRALEASELGGGERRLLRLQNFEQARFTARRVEPDRKAPGRQQPPSRQLEVPAECRDKHSGSVASFLRNGNYSGWAPPANKRRSAAPWPRPSARRPADELRHQLRQIFDRRRRRVAQRQQPQRDVRVGPRQRLPGRDRLLALHAQPRVSRFHFN